MFAFCFLVENLRTELQQKYSLELDETSRSHQMQLQAARMELERAIELSGQKVFFCFLLFVAFFISCKVSM